MCVVVAALYFAQEVLIPLALAILITFLLATLVTRLERWKLGRVPSVRMLLRSMRVCRAPSQARHCFQPIASYAKSSVLRSSRFVASPVSVGSAGVTSVPSMFPVPT